MTHLVAELVADARSWVGEGPLWDARSQVLRWLDVFGQKLHTFDPSTGSALVVDLAERVASIGVRSSGGLLAATPRGFEALEPDTGELVLLVEVEHDQPENRMNDGKCDPAGRFWAGTMCDGEPNRGTLYRLDPDLSVAPQLANISVSNGLCWSPDATTMYFIDTPTQGIDAFDYDIETGQISRRRRLVNVPAGFGSADGMSIDADGHLWVATWGSGAVRRYSPDGQADHVIEVPVSQPSSCCFGGADLRDLYITSATYDMDDAALEAEPAAGGLFRCRLDVAGQPVPEFAG